MKSELLKKLSIGLAMIGLLDSAYLTWIKLSNTEAYCAGIGQCDVVNQSEYAEFFGIPIALLGLGAYITILILHWMEDKENIVGENSLSIIMGLTFIGVIYSAYLTYIELFVLYAVCPFCVISAIVILLMSGIAVWRFLQED